jgi:hypothetical protein
MRAVLVLLVATALLAPTATARLGHDAAEGNCHAGAVALLFWPHGHPELVTGGQPASKIAHVELFRHAGARTYLPTNQIAYADANGKVSIDSSCKPKRQQSTFYDVRPARETLKAAVIACTVPDGAVVQVRRSQTKGSELRVMDPPNKVVLLAVIGPRSKVVHSRWLCATGAPVR